VPSGPLAELGDGEQGEGKYLILGSVESSVCGGGDENVGSACCRSAGEGFTPPNGSTNPLTTDFNFCGSGRGKSSDERWHLFE
jgi:hypothetical protein